MMRAFFGVTPLSMGPIQPLLPRVTGSFGLALTNIARYDEALAAWRVAENLTTDHGRRAHLCYLQGLVEAKRRYDLADSEMHYLRGLDELHRGEGKQTASDLNLEQAWLLNGLALNQALAWRRAPQEAKYFQAAFETEQRAFNLIRDGAAPERLYLRFNLLANLSFLLEMSGRYDHAIATLSRAFDIDLPPSASAHRLRSTLAYRVGVLHYRAGELDRAVVCLDRAIEYDEHVELWSTRERILRAMGVVALRSDHAGRAEAAFRQGLNICRAERSAEGTWEHGRGLVTALLLQDERHKARDVFETVREEEGLLLTAAFPPQDETSQPSPPSPKLPAYIPEIDLEGIPAIDLNRFLGGAMPDEASVAEPWSN
jgi:tetratricopeptide (TPR) repeat protein